MLKEIFGKSSEMFVQNTIDSLIAFAMTAFVCVALAQLAARANGAAVPLAYVVAVIGPLVIDELLDGLAFFSPRGGHFLALWLWGPTTAVVGTALVAVIRRRLRTLATA